MRGWFQQREHQPRDGGWRDWTYVLLVIGLVLLALIVVGFL